MEGKRVAKKNKQKAPLVIRILLVICLVLAVIVAACYGFIYYFTSKLGGTGIDESKNQSLEEILQAMGEGESAGSLAELLESADEETREAVSKADEDLKKQQNAEVKVSKKITNYLLIGQDRRGSSGYGNADVQILVSVNEDTGKIHLTSLMRAMYVTIPGKSSGMLNWAFPMGGPELAVKTVEENFKVKIDHYACVDFSIFKDVVDAVGGVDLNLTYGEASFINSQTGYQGAMEGMNHLNGEQALAHARNRNLDNDFVRTSRQRDIVESILKSMRGLSVSELTNMANVVLPAISTDLADKPGQVTKILADAPAMLKYDIDQLMLPVENMEGKTYTGITSIGGHEMYLVDWENNLKTLEDFING